MSVYENCLKGLYDRQQPKQQEGENVRDWQKRARAEEREIRDRLKADLEQDHGLENHPKKDLLWEKAWDHGHASGFAEVVIYYDDLADLLK